MFGTPNRSARKPWETPGIGDGLGDDPVANPGETDLAPLMAQKGMLGSRRKGGTLKGIAGVIGDYLLSQSGMGPIYLPAVQRRNEMEAQEQQYQRRLQDQWGLWEKKQEYERANPKPVNNDTVADYNFIMQTAGPEAAKQYILNKANPIQGVRVTNPDGSEGIQFIRPGAAAPQSGTPVGHVEDGYEFIGGDDTDERNWRKVGGPSPSGSATFP